MKTGKVTYWNRERHYGFIRCDDGSADHFVRGSALRDADTVYVGDTVLFEIARDRQRHRERAVNVSTDKSASGHPSRGRERQCFCRIARAKGHKILVLGGT